MSSETERIVNEVLGRYEQQVAPREQVFELTTLQHAETGDGPWRLYLYNNDGFHGRPRWFRNGPMKYPNEEITPQEAKEKADANHAIGREVRITDGGDMLVFHSVDGEIVYGENFWKEIGL
jgi:hypothetical protein